MSLSRGLLEYGRPTRLYQGDDIYYTRRISTEDLNLYTSLEQNVQDFITTPHNRMQKFCKIFLNKVHCLVDDILLYTHHDGQLATNGGFKIEKVGGDNGIIVYTVTTEGSSREDDNPFFYWTSDAWRAFLLCGGTRELHERLQPSKSDVLHKMYTTNVLRKDPYLTKNLRGKICVSQDEGGLYVHQAYIRQIVQVLENGEEDVHRRLLIIARTGSGKTFIILQMICDFIRRRKPIILTLKDRTLALKMYDVLLPFLTRQLRVAFPSDMMDQVRAHYADGRESRPMDPFNKYVGGLQLPLLVTTIDEFNMVSKNCRRKNYDGFKQIWGEMTQKFHTPVYIFDEIHLLESGAYKTLVDFLHTSCLGASIYGFTATPDFKVTNAIDSRERIMFNDIYKRIFGKAKHRPTGRVPFVYYGDDAGFRQIIVSPQQSSFRKIQKFHKMMLKPKEKSAKEWVEYCVAGGRFYQDSPLKDCVYSGIYYMNEKSRQKVRTFELPETDKDKNVYSSIDLVRQYFPLGYTVKQQIDRLLRDKKRVIVLADESSGMYAFAKMLHTFYGKQYRSTLDGQRDKDLDKLLPELSDETKCRILLYDVGTYTEGHDIWNFHDVINCATYKNSVLKFVQAIGRGNRLCKTQNTSDPMNIYCSSITGTTHSDNMISLVRNYKTKYVNKLQALNQCSVIIMTDDA